MRTIRVSVLAMSTSGWPAAMFGQFPVNGDFARERRAQYSFSKIEWAIFNAVFAAFSVLGAVSVKFGSLQFPQLRYRFMVVTRCHVCSASTHGFVPLYSARRSVRCSIYRFGSIRRSYPCATRVPICTRRLIRTPLTSDESALWRWGWSVPSRIS